MRLLFDIETTLIPKTKHYALPEKIWCAVVRDFDNGDQWTFTPDTIHLLPDLLCRASMLIGHNIIGFDLPVIKHILGWSCPEEIELYDTLVVLRAMFPDLWAVPKMWNHDGPKHLRFRHSLEAWGARVGQHKLDFKEFDAYSEEMLKYCIGDIDAQENVYQYCEATEQKMLGIQKFLVNDTYLSVAQVENWFARVMQQQKEHGVCFDVKCGEELYIKLLERRQQLLDDNFKDTCIVLKGKQFVPKRTSKIKGQQYTKDVPMTKIAIEPFEPKSSHIAKLLWLRHKHQPTEFTETGAPSFSEDILKQLPYPEGKVLAEIMIIDKRLGQLYSGNKAWLSSVKDGKIHGSVISSGAITRRPAYNSPCLSQVPAVYSEYGKECRSLFKPITKGWKQVGVDASGIELRCLAHYLEPLDGGELKRAVLHGEKAKETDPHSLNKKALGITSRDKAKTWFYAFIYGGGYEVLGKAIEPLATAPEAKKLGKKTKTRFEKNMHRLKTLKSQVAGASKRGYLKAIDGSKLWSKAEYTSLNTLLQGAGAIIMKLALVIFHLETSRLYRGKFNYLLNVVDEWQLEVDPEFTEELSNACIMAMRYAGERLDMRVPLDGEAKVGNNWAETH